MADMNARGAPRVDTVVLDMDGTLVDSVYVRTVAWRAAFSDVGLAVPSHRIHQVIGMGGDRAVAWLMGDAVERAVGQEVRRRHGEHFERLLGDVGPTDGAAELLTWLREVGLLVVVASSGEPPLTARLLETIDGGPGLVHHVVGLPDGGASKPAPDLFLAALEGVGGRQALVVGDAVWDVRAAVAAGMSCLAVRTGGIGDAALLAAGAAAVVEDPRELLGSDVLRAALSR